MKKLIMPLLLALMLITTGCMQVEMATELNKDGSGTYAFSFASSIEVEEALKELSQMEGGMGDDMDEFPDFSDFDKSDLEKRLSKHDVKLTKYSNDIKDGKRVVSMEMSFKNLAGLQAAMTLSGVGGEGGVGIEKMEDGNYLLHHVEPPAVEDEAEAEEVDMPDMSNMENAMENAAKSMEIMGKLMAHSSELSMIMKVTLPSDVIEHNAPELDGRTCIWDINSSNMMSAGDMEPRIVFSGKGVNIK